MSGLPDDDENPFGVSFHYKIKNFKDKLKSFLKDPSVQNAVTSNQSAKVNLDDYNPFDGSKTATTNQSSAVMSGTEEPPPAVAVTEQQAPSQVSTADFQVTR